MGTIVIRLGDTVGTNRMVYEYSGNERVSAVPLSISNTSTTSITYSLGVVNNNYVTYTSYAYLNYLLIT